MNTSKASAPLATCSKRFAAKLLFQFRVVIDGDSGMRRLCESQIIHFKAEDAKEALREAKKRARKRQHAYENSDGNTVRFEFIGVEELLCLDPGCKPDEVWYDIHERLRPMERRAILLPTQKQLNAIRNKD